MQHLVGTIRGHDHHRSFYDRILTYNNVFGSTGSGPRHDWIGTKNPDDSDTLYVAELIGPDVISTVPDHTLHAFADHRRVERTLDADPRAARTLADAAAAGIDLAAITAQLEREGVKAFCDSYRELLGSIEGRLGAVAGARP